MGPAMRRQLFRRLPGSYVPCYTAKPLFSNAVTSVTAILLAPTRAHVLQARQARLSFDILPLPFSLSGLFEYGCPRFIAAGADGSRPYFAFRHLRKGAPSRE